MKLSTAFLICAMAQQAQSFHGSVRGPEGLLDHPHVRKAKSKSGKKSKETKSSIPKQGKKKGKADNDEEGFGQSADSHQMNERATKLLTGTELFQENVYSQPVVSPEDSFSHCLLEGARSYMRLQADFNTTLQAEEQWLDKGYHQGRAELVQLEQVEDGNGGHYWELVHYRHPWTARADGGRADGLVRDVVMKHNQLTNPKQVYCISGPFTNRVTTHTGGGAWNTFAYAIYVTQGSPEDDLVFIGKGLNKHLLDFDTTPEYPVKWAWRKLSDFADLGDPGSRFGVQKYVQTPWHTSFDHSDYGIYQTQNNVEHIVVYYQKYFVVFTLLDWGQTDGTMEIALNRFHYHSGNTGHRITHIDWLPDPSQDQWKRLHNIVTVRSEFESNGAVKYHSAWMHYSKATQMGQKGFGGDKNYYTVVKWGDDYKHNSFEPTEHKKDSNFHVDFSSIHDVHELYVLDGIACTSGMDAYVKIVNVKGNGIFTMVITHHPNGDYFLDGMFKFQLPDANGVGEIENFSGGTSKFGGLRFLASDQNGNLFMMRQRGYQSPTSAYELPMYGLNNERGQPLTFINYAYKEQLPDGTSSASNLQGLDDWFQATTTTGDSPLLYNILRNAALAFGTDESNVAQGLYFGSGYKAAYAMKRFGMDSEHVVVRSVGSSDTNYVAISTFKNPVTKAWHKRPIATQVLPDTVNKETGDHYQATLTFANYAGQTVSPLNEANSGLKIEVRCDSPCTITDDTNGFYHNADRYTSFMAQPDPSSGSLSLTVPADSFSQVIYARIVNATALRVSSDRAILNSIDANIYPWVAVNMAEKAQQRMSNGESSSTSTLADKREYMSKQSLQDSNTNNAWQTKGGYKTTSSNMEDLSTYCTTSGANLLVTTDELGMGGGADSINPLFSLTDIPQNDARPYFTTRFSYEDGSIESDYGSNRGLRGQEHRELNMFSDLSHDLHDALHYLQHVEGKVYKELGNDGVAIASSAEGLTVTVSKDIMKEMKGVKKALTQVVNTVEEYASIVLNVIVTIVEESFIFTFIELLIALISMFQYFGDIYDLSKSFAKRFDGMDFLNSQDFTQVTQYIQDFFGPNNEVSKALNSFEANSGSQKGSNEFMDEIMNNPITTKILHGFTSALNQAEKTVGLPLPFEFKMDEGPSLKDTSETMNEAVAGFEKEADTLLQIVEGAAEDVVKPDDFYKDLQDDLGTIAGFFGASEVEEVMTQMGDDLNVAGNDPFSVSKNMLKKSNYIEIHLPELSDLMKLFGIGDWSGNTLNVHAKDAVFFPMAMIAWVVEYTKNGHSIKDVSSFMGDTVATENGVQVSSPNFETWNEIVIISDMAFKGLKGLAWVGRQLQVLGNDNEGLIQFGTWMGWMQNTNDILFYFGTNPDPLSSQMNYILTNIQTLQLAMGLKQIYIASRSSITDEQQQQLDWLDYAGTATGILVTALPVLIGPSDSHDAAWIVNTMGKGIAKSQSVWAFIYKKLKSKTSAEFDLFTTLVCGSPVLGYSLELLALVDM